MQQQSSSGGDLDAQLLSGASRSGDFRESQREEPNYLEEEPRSTRQAVIQERRKKEAEEKKKGKPGLKGGTATVRSGSSSLLRAAWLNLIPSWGLTLFWINTHVFLGNVLGEKFFCKLGDEWTDKLGATAPVAEGDLGKKVTKSIGLVEKIGLFILDMGCLLIVIAIFALLALLLKVVDSPVVKLLLPFIDGFKWVWNAIAKIVGVITGN